MIRIRTLKKKDTTAPIVVGVTPTTVNPPTSTSLEGLSAATAAAIYQAVVRRAHFAVTK